MIRHTAEKTYEQLSGDDRAAVNKALNKLARGAAPHTLMQSGKAAALGVTHTIRAGSALRVALNKRPGGAWELVDFIRRGDKRLYSNE